MKKQLILIIFLVQTLVILGQTSLKTEHVFWITYDGLRWQEMFSGIDSVLLHEETYTEGMEKLAKEFWHEDPSERRKKLSPFFWEVIAKEGQLYGNRKYGNYVNLRNNQWFSYPGYNEILCGFPDSAITSNAKILNQNETVLEFINKQKGFEGKVAAFASWDVFPFIINEKRSGIPVNAGFEAAKGEDLSNREIFLNELQNEIPSPWPTVRLDAFTHHYAKEYVQKHWPKVVYIAYGETDDFAHDGNYNAYIRSARQTDAFIGEWWNWLQSQETYRDKTTLIISTDHGRGTQPIDTWRSHGTQIEGADEIWIAILGPDSPPLGELKTNGQLYQNQMAKTIAKLLGFDYSNRLPVGEIIPKAFQKSE